MLSLIATALLTTMSYAASESGRNRVRAIASSDANAQLERTLGLLQVGAAGTEADRCALLTAVGGPFDVASGGTLTGTCPLFTASNVPVQGSALRRTISLTSEDIGTGHPGLHVRIVVSGSQLLRPLTFDTHVRR